VETHGIRERAREEVVIADRDLGDDVCETPLLVRGQVENGGDVSAVREHWKSMFIRRKKVK
jgi:hypothetical protein